MINGKRGHTSVRRLLRALEFDSAEDLEQQQWLHNAGNDAVWTMKALVAMAQAETQSPGSSLLAILGARDADREEKLASKLAGQAAHAANQAASAAKKAARAAEWRATHVT
jgi:hypothetical protein